MGVRVAVRGALHAPRFESTLDVLRVGRRFTIHGPARPVLLRLAERPAAATPAPTSPDVHLSRSDDAVDQLRRSGAVEGLRLRPAAVHALIDAWEADPARRLIGVEERSAVARRLLDDPLLLHLAGGYLRSTPRPLGVTLTMALPGLDPPPSFHYETTDLRTLLVYFPLVAPPDGSGGHEVVLHTHGRKPLWEIARLRHSTDRATQDRSSHRATFAPVPGTGWAEDPALLHRRLPATGPRLMVTVGYAMRRTTVAGSCGYFRVDLPEGLHEPVLVPRASSLVSSE